MTGDQDITEYTYNREKGEMIQRGNQMLIIRKRRRRKKIKRKRSDYSGVQGHDKRQRKRKNKV